LFEDGSPGVVYHDGRKVPPWRADDCISTLTSLAFVANLSAVKKFAMSVSAWLSTKPGNPQCRLDYRLVFRWMGPVSFPLPEGTPNRSQPELAITRPAR
jgi:hypothetical protein